MSTTVDERVVEMRFDNKQFESNVSTTMSTLSKLKESLNFKGASKGLEEVNAASNRCDMRGLSNAVETVQAKFSALQVMGVTALMNITNSAVNAGKRIVSALTIDPVMTGFQEYETQINAVQTILANTESKGSTLEDVNSALDELNHYADLTIYNFTEMTRNIGTFTAAGVDLDTSVSAIKGIANLAAVSGSTSQQASTAMYQLSQALAAGTVKLQDWNSVVNAGMGGQVFQDALKETAKVHNVKIDEMIKKEGSFRETLKNGWLTSEILTETLSKFTGDLSEKQLKQMGYTDEQIKKIMKMGQTANDAATKVKTFTQLWDTLKEAAQSGWTQSWEIIIGDFEEAKKFLTEISDTVSDMLNKSSDARNKILQGWKDLGGRDDLIQSLRNGFQATLALIAPIKEAFKEIFPPVTAQTLANITSALKDFTAHLIVSDETADKIKRTFKGVFSVLDMFRKGILLIASAIGGILKSGVVGSIADFILSITASIGDFLTTLNNGFSLDGLGQSISKIVDTISNAIKSIFTGFDGFGDKLSSVGKSISDVFSGIWNAIKQVFSWISSNVSVGDVLSGLVGAGTIVSLKQMIEMVKSAKGFFDGGILGVLFGNGDDNAVSDAKGFKENFSDILGSVNETLQSFTKGVKVASVLGIATAIGILAHSLKTISQIDAADVVKSLGAIGLLMTMLNLEFKSLSKALSVFDNKGIIKAGVSLILVAEAIKVLSDALVKIGTLSLTEVGKGLLGVGGSLLILAGALKIIDKVKIPLKTSVSILTLATSCKILASVFESFSGLSWEEIGRGLTAMGGALLEMVGTLAVLKKVGGAKSLVGSASLLIAVHALRELADGLTSFSGLSWEEIGRGLAGMGGALGELAIAVGVLGKLSGFSGILGAAAIVTVAQCLTTIAEALQRFAFMTWDEIAHGLVGMGGALTEVAVVCGVLGKLAGFSAILGSGAIVIVVKALDEIVNAFQQFGSMGWDQITQGLVGMGGALTEVAVVCGVLGKLAGFSAILGSGAILIVVQSLGTLAEAFGQFGNMSWDEIARGLVGMGGALTEVSVISGALGSLAGLPALLGGGAILLAVQGLGDLADAFKKFGEMQWDEIGRGLAAMGGALSEVAIGGLLNTLSGFGAGAISEVAGPLGTLADSVQKWAYVELPETLGTQLAGLADGVGKFTLSGWGADAISTLAEPIGTLAESIQKWTNVSVPEGLGDQIGSLASGVSAFTLSGMGGEVINTIAAPIGTLADSVKKWVDVSVPEGLGDQLKGLADGVGAFTLAFVGGMSIDTIAEPLGTLADSVKKWKDVTVPEDIGDQLKRVADGVSSLGWALIGSWSLETIANSIGTLADGVSKLSKVKVPDDLGTKLDTFATAIKSFASKIKSITEIDSGKIESFASGVDKLCSTTKKVSSVKVSGVDDFVKAVNKLGKIKIDDSVSSSADSLSSSITKLVNTIKTKLSGSKSSISNSMKTALSGLSSAVKSTTSSVSTDMESLVNKLTSTISSKKGSVDNAFKDLVSGAKDAVRNQYSSMSSAGGYLGDGLIEGINSKKQDAYNAGYALGQKAVQGEKDGQKSKSPSRLTMQAGKWLGEGLIIGMQTIGSKVYNAGSTMGRNASESIESALSLLSNTDSIDLDVNPTIRPVMDLDDVIAGANSINNMLGGPMQLGVAANIDSINSMMNQRIQNGTNDDVISAIDKLNRSLNNLERPSYTINGVTYDDGSNISNAVRDIVRAARVERRI